MISKNLLEKTLVSSGMNLDQLSMDKPVFLVFLRQFGCIYCKEALSDVRNILSELDKREISLVLVHMSSLEDSKQYLSKFGLENALQISDPECLLYAEFGLIKGTMGQLFGLKVWSRGFTQMIKGNNYSLRPVGDGFQMPGIFIILNGEVKNMFFYNSIADKPDYLKLIDDVIKDLN